MTTDDVDKELLRMMEADGIRPESNDDRYFGDAEVAHDYEDGAVLAMVQAVADGSAGQREAGIFMEFFRGYIAAFCPTRWYA